MNTPYRAHVNDVAVFLLQKHCYRQAFSKFIQAIQVLENDLECCPVVENVSLEPFPRPPKITFETISGAKLMQSPQRTAQLFCDSRETTRKSERIILINLGTDASDELWKPIQLSIALFNYATAKELFARALCKQGRPIMSKMQRQDAARLFQMADSVCKSFALEIANCGDPELVAATYALRRIVLVGLRSNVKGTAKVERVEQRIHKVHSMATKLDQRRQTKPRTRGAAA